MNTLNFSAIFQVLPEGLSAAKLQQLTEILSTYYQEGHKYYTDKVSLEDKFDHEDLLQFICRLHKLTQDFARKAEDLSITMRRGKEEINIYPIVDFLEQYSPAECLALLEVIHTAMVEYLHEENYVSFKSAHKSLSHWRSVFTEIANQ
ncbi:MAG: hypothetical protein ABJG41_01300 [Cyclobacteriaceae bacterium]